ncbi:MAG TPA: hypothetical protein VJP04_05690 [Terriglobales bacterium]|nr:hypothetical protein [Terriglobales bacterium]
MPAPPPPPEPGHDMFYVRTFRLEDNKAVTGAPYSADATTENTQVLSDGNRIERKETAKVYRDTMGRTRRDLSVNAIGPWSSGAPMQMANIFDPVAGVHYMLNMQEKKAFKMPSPRKPPAGGPGLMTKDRVFFAGREVTAAAPGMALVEKDAGIGNRTETSLGTQEMEGVQTQGTRTIETIPAGKIGNEKPIVITTERWYSPDLQVDVLVKHNDPRMGEVVYQLTNISREDPDASLFQVPADYTVQQGPMVLQKRLH